MATRLIKKDNSCTNMTKLYNYARVVFLALADDASCQYKNNIKTNEKAHFGSIYRRTKCFSVVITILRYFSLFGIELNNSSEKGREYSTRKVLISQSVGCR